ncbi:MAG: mannosyl-3-phosphoglycerate phosphatase [Hyphomicrobiales bacterium]|nr:MAG: mannosyl-3-phosphoglycerate phosphatase [Hyphomicrobiales bacterium]
MRKIVIFSDLDGTLLDHRSYSHAAAREALAALKDQGVPLVLASSKTASEIAPLRAELGFAHCPAIVENGAGILQPARGIDAHIDERDYNRLVAAVMALPGAVRRGFRGFSDMSAGEVAEITGLSLGDAANAKMRQFSEPGLWSGDDEGRARFLAALAPAGIVAKQGGRFLTLSFGGTKADRMADLAASLADGGTPFVVALGDAPNDAEMLGQADIGVIVANPSAPPMPDIAVRPGAAILRTRDEGPAGWNAAILAILADSEGASSAPAFQ